MTVTTDNGQLVRDAYRAFAAGDIPTVLQFLEEDMVWQVPGRSPISGVFTGHEGVLDFFGRCLELSGGTLRISVDEVLSEGERVMVLCTVAAERNGRAWSSPEVQVWRVADGRATHFREFQGDQETEDAFWSS